MRKAHSKPDALSELCEQELAALFQTGQPKLGKAWRYHLKARGKRVRLRLALLAGALFDLSERQCVELAKACELIHQASLVHDDLLDRDEYRNGHAAIWVAFDDATAICLGDALLTEAIIQMTCLSSLNSEQITQLAHLTRAAIQAAAEGQIEDCQKDAIFNYDYNEYSEAVKRKSGALLGLPVLGAMTVAGYSAAQIQKTRDVFSEFGIAYQLFDDLSDREGDKGKRLNGYWLLKHLQPKATEQLLKQHAEQHLLSAQTMLTELPAAAQECFLYLRDAMFAQDHDMAETG